MVTTYRVSNRLQTLLLTDNTFLEISMVLASPATGPGHISACVPLVFPSEQQMSSL